MKNPCPVCKKGSLKEGFIQAGSEIVWAKKPLRLRLITTDRKGEKIIAPISLTKLAHQHAAYCDNCGAVITFVAQ